MIFVLFTALIVGLSLESWSLSVYVENDRLESLVRDNLTKIIDQLFLSSSVKNPIDIQVFQTRCFLPDKNKLSFRFKRIEKHLRHEYRDLLLRPKSKSISEKEAIAFYHLASYNYNKGDFYEKRN